MPLVRAVTKYRNGDIRLTFHSAWAASVLTEEAEHWLPVFSSFLQLRAPTFLVVMHRVSTDFEVGTGLPNDDDSERDNNIPELVAKKHSSLVVHFSDVAAANRAVTRELALHGHLHRTEKHSPQPMQCFNCYSFGHIASQCKHPAVVVPALPLTALPIAPAPTRNHATPMPNAPTS
ncbi:hypothetical protein DFH09DRAFT_1331807 [Mycena vulgaris]|nr:hypothetical protein DFH09DRAFT_1331807 [Mycena vulgaris]